MKNIYIKTILISALAIMPAVSSAYMLDPYPINANDNRTVYNAAVTTSLALVGQNQNPVYQTVQASVPQQVVVPAQATYAVNTTQPAQVYSNVSANSGTQTYVGTGTNTYTANTAYTQPVYTSVTSQNVASNSWTYNLPTQSLMPASVATTQNILSNPKLVAMDTSYKYSYANALPSYYGAGATSGIYTTYGGQSYDPSNVYESGLARATGNSTRTNSSYSNTSGNISGEWIQTSSGWKQAGVRENTSGHIPW